MFDKLCESDGLGVAMSTTASGQAFEQLALHYLEQRGLGLVERNYRCRVGELDLIMRDANGDNRLVFVEVRGRSSHRYGGPSRS